MQSVDLLIANIDWLITIDTQRRVIRDASVAVDQGRIVAIDKAAEIAKRFAGKQLIDGVSQSTRRPVGPRSNYSTPPMQR